MDVRRLFDSPDFFPLAFEPQAVVLAEMDRDARAPTVDLSNFRTYY